MTDPIRTPSEALEAAAQICRSVRVGLERHRTRRLAQPDEHTATVCDRLAERIAALAPRIAAPDDEALVKDLAKHMSKSHACDWPCEDPKYCQCIEEAAQAVKFLRGAGALR